MNQQTIKKTDTRDYHVDNIKGILIFLVVCGHLLSTLQDMDSTFAIGVRTLIYFFHMPGFIFMSGYLAKGFLKKEYKRIKIGIDREKFVIDNNKRFLKPILNK